MKDQNCTTFDNGPDKDQSNIWTLNPKKTVTDGLLGDNHENENTEMAPWEVLSEAFLLSALWSRRVMYEKRWTDIQYTDALFRISQTL